MFRPRLLPSFHNASGRWYDPDGIPISAERAGELMWDPVTRILAAEDQFGDPDAGVLTYFSPFDLLPARGKAADPHLYCTVEQWSECRPLHRARVRQEFTHFAQTRVAALAAHEQAVSHVRDMVGHNWRWWRRVPW